MVTASFFPSLPITNSALIFFVVLTIILFAPIILNRLHIPHIIGLIFAGMIVGPYGLNLLAYDASFGIFGNVGLLYLMFLVGLEMSISDFKKNKREGIMFGIYTFAIPLVFGLLTSKYLLGISWLASSLLATVYASHTLIAFPIVSRYGTSK
ncbi:MAG: cation:proton antiporter, partial [Bacteroidales bacterium]